MEVKGKGRRYRKERSQLRERSEGRKGGGESLSQARRGEERAWYPLLALNHLMAHRSYCVKFAL